MDAQHADDKGRVLAALRKLGDRMLVAEIAEEAGINTSRTQAALDHLKDEGLADYKLGMGLAEYWSLTAKAKE